MRPVFLYKRAVNYAYRGGRRRASAMEHLFEPHLTDSESFDLTHAFPLQKRQRFCWSAVMPGDAKK
jgi:hypothetical protein